MAASGKYVACQLCDGVGELRCDVCGGKGKVGCTVCLGEGEYACALCLGGGQLLRRWQLTTVLTSSSSHRCWHQEPWPMDTTPLISEAVELLSYQWKWPDLTSLDLSGLNQVPFRLRDVAHDILQTSIKQTENLDSKHERMCGLRVRVLGTYGYFFEVRYGNREGHLILAGNNRVISRSLPTKPPNLFRKASALLSRGLGFEQLEERPGLEREFLIALTEDRAHLADIHCLVPEVADAINADVQVSVDGYSLTLPGPAAASCSIGFRLGANGQLLLCTGMIMGPAYRDRFAAMLEVNHVLSFGRVAIVQPPGTAQAYFALVDRRPYELLAVSEYAQILMTMTREIPVDRAL